MLHVPCGVCRDDVIIHVEHRVCQNVSKRLASATRQVDKIGGVTFDNTSHLHEHDIRKF